MKSLATLGYAFLLAPLAIVAVLSLSSGQYLTFPPPGFSTRWYQALWSSAPVLDAAGKSVVLAILVTVIALLAGFPAALAVARGGAPGWISGLLSLPLLLPTLVIGLGLLMVLQPLGLLATWPGLALGHLMVVLPFVVRLLVTALRTLPPDLEAAAATLGARPGAAFFLVTVPLAAPGALAAATLSFLLSFDETVISLFLVGPRLTTLPVTMFNYAETRTDPMLAALAVSLIVLSLAIVLAVDRLVGVTRALGQGMTMDFKLEKHPATGSKGMVVTNHPLASGAGAQILLAGGNAIDAAVTALFVLTVVEPMMVGIAGGGLSHIRLADGTHTILDGISTAPHRATPDMYRPVSDVLPNYQETEGRLNNRGALAVAIPGALLGWCTALERFGTIALDDALAPAIALADRGFTTTPYLSTCVGDCAADLLKDPGLAEMFMPGGAPLPAGTRLRRPDYAATLRLVAQLGPAALYDGPLGAALTDYMQSAGGLIDRQDLANYRMKERAPISGHYRGYEIVGPPPPSSSGVHMTQMLNLLEGFDVAALGFGTADGVHLLAEVMKIAFADRAIATADPDFVDIPVDRLTSPAYADQRRAEIDLHQARNHTPGIPKSEGNDTTHLTVADSLGNVVAATQTINSLFGAAISVPGTGIILNNYMFNFDPHPGHALSIQPGKRVFTSMAPTMALRDGRLAYALGLPGAIRIFPSAMQALINLIDHRMTLQQAVEAPRMFTQGHVLELETPLFDRLAPALRARGHDIRESPRIAGGMNAIAFKNGMLEGAACWRADGTPVAIAGGLAKAGVRFVI